MGMDNSPQACARELLEVVPGLMQRIRIDMRNCRTPDLSVPQFRSLVFVNRNPGASLSDVSEFLGLALPSASKLIDGLVKRDLVEREASLVDRRRVTLRLTEKGQRSLGQALQCTQECFTEALAGLSTQERSRLLEAMRILSHTFLHRVVDE